MSSISSALKNTKDNLWRSASKYFGGRNMSGGSPMEGGVATGFAKAFPTYAKDPVYLAFPGKGQTKPIEFKKAFERDVSSGDMSLAQFKAKILGGSSSPRASAIRKPAASVRRPSATASRKAASGARSVSPFTTYTKENYEGFKAQRVGKMTGPQIWEAFLNQYQNSQFRADHPPKHMPPPGPSVKRVDAKGNQVRSPLGVASDLYYGKKGAIYRQALADAGEVVPVSGAELWAKFKAEKYMDVRGPTKSKPKNDNARPTAYQRWLSANYEQFPVQSSLNHGDAKQKAQYVQQKKDRKEAWMASPEFGSKSPLNTYAQTIVNEYSAPGGIRDQLVGQGMTKKEAWAKYQKDKKAGMSDM